MIIDPSTMYKILMLNVIFIRFFVNKTIFIVINKILKTSNK